jgi:hypothetical protein
MLFESIEGRGVIPRIPHFTLYGAMLGVVVVLEGLG